MKMLHLTRSAALALCCLIFFAVAGPAGAQTVITAGTDSSVAPGTVTVSGTLAKYIHFDAADTTINLTDLGGPTLGAAGMQTFGSNLGTVTPANVAATGTDNDAEITFDSNSCLQLDIVNGADLSNRDDATVNHDDTLPTYFRTWVKGKSVVVSGLAAPITDNVNYTDLGLTASGGAAAGSTNPQPAIIYDNGPANGVRLDAQVERNGMDDHYGVYTSGLTLTWSDWN